MIVDSRSVSYNAKLVDDRMFKRVYGFSDQISHSTGNHIMKIIPLDLDFQYTARTIAAYLVIGDGGPVLVETGPMSTLPALRAGLAECGYLPSDVRHVLVTHIHLDHAGAAG